MTEEADHLSNDRKGGIFKVEPIIFPNSLDFKHYINILTRPLLKMLREIQVACMNTPASVRSELLIH